MTHDPELDAWKALWQARDTVPAELRRRVEHEIRMGRRALLAPVAVTALVGGGMLAWALFLRGRELLVLAAATWAFIAITWLTALVLDRRIGHSRVPEAVTTSAFLDFTIRVCRGKRASIAAAAALCPIFLAFILVWRYQTGAFESLGVYFLTGRVISIALLIAAVTLVLGILGLRKYRALGIELGNLHAMQRRFEDGGEASGG